MARSAITQKQFLKNLKQADIINDTTDYDYSKVVYTNSRHKIIIGCKEHGDFEMRTDARLTGQICQKCCFIGGRITNEEFIKRSKELDILKGVEYDYSKCLYTIASKKVILGCSKHGWFSIKANGKLMGTICKKCANQISAKRQTHDWKDIIFKLKEKDKKSNLNYDYSLIDYENTHAKVKVICSKHGEFETSIHNRLQGTICKACNYENNNYRKSHWIKKAKNRKGIFYIIKCFNENEEFFKFGITFNSVKQRYKHKTFMPYNYEVIKVVKSKDLSYIWGLEKRFKQFKRKSHYKPFLHFAGDRYECFKN